MDSPMLTAWLNLLSRSAGSVTLGDVARGGPTTMVHTGSMDLAFTVLDGGGTAGGDTGDNGRGPFGPPLLFTLCQASGSFGNAPQPVGERMVFFHGLNSFVGEHQLVPHAGFPFF